MRGGGIQSCPTRSCKLYPGQGGMENSASIEMSVNHIRSVWCRETCPIIFRSNGWSWLTIYNAVKVSTVRERIYHMRHFLLRTSAGSGAVWLFTALIVLIRLEAQEAAIYISIKLVDTGSQITVYLCRLLFITSLFLSFGEDWVYC